MNKALYKMIGYTEKELLTTDFQSITYSADLGTDLKYVEQLLSGEIESYQMEKRYIHKDGRQVWALLAVSLVRGLDNAPRYFVAQIQDVSAQKQLEEAKRRYDDQFKRLVNGVTDYAIYTLSPEGKITSWNAGAKRIKRYPTEKVAGQSFEIFFTKEDREKGEPRRILDIALRQGKFEGEGVRVRGDGTHFHAHVVLDAIRGLDGELVGFAKITRDISEITDH